MHGKQDYRDARSNAWRCSESQRRSPPHGWRHQKPNRHSSAGTTFHPRSLTQRSRSRGCKWRWQNTFAGRTRHCRYRGRPGCSASSVNSGAWSCGSENCWSTRFNRAASEGALLSTCLEEWRGRCDLAQGQYQKHRRCIWRTDRYWRRSLGRNRGKYSRFCRGCCYLKQRRTSSSILCRTHRVECSCWASNRFKVSWDRQQDSRDWPSHRW